MLDSREPEYPISFDTPKSFFFDVFFNFLSVSGLIFLFVRDDFHGNFLSTWNYIYFSFLLVCLGIWLFAIWQAIRNYKNRTPTLTVFRNGCQTWDFFFGLRTCRWDEIEGIKSTRKRYIVFLLKEEVVAKRYLEDKSRFKYLFNLLRFERNTYRVGHPSIGDSAKKAKEALLRSYNDFKGEI